MATRRGNRKGGGATGRGGKEGSSREGGERGGEGEGRGGKGARRGGISQMDVMECLGGDRLYG